MLTKVCNLAALSSLVFVLCACGGGDPGTEPAGAPAAFAPGVTNADAPQAPAAASTTAAVPYGAEAAPAAPAAPADPLAIQATGQVVTMHGGGAYAIGSAARTRRVALAGGGASRVLDSRVNDPELADDGARERMAFDEVEYEKSFSLEMNRQHAERRAQDGATEQWVHQPYVPHEDCLDPRLPECHGNPRLARY